MKHLFSSPKILFQPRLLQHREWILPLYDIAENFAIITDHHVKELFSEPFKALFSGVNVHLFSFPPGEMSKTRSMKESIEDQMMEARLGRDTLVIALGGGVVSDLAGFVAATYCRGIPYVNIPTTLLAQVDACFGGKVALNTPFGKNMIGAFYNPHTIIIDKEVLHKLPVKEIINGKAEMIKYALIGSKALFNRFKQSTTWYEHIEECLLMKKEVVEKDPHEGSLRRVLNFGHTFGHALEVVLDYTISHGEAIAWGMLGEAYVSHLLGFLSKEEVSEIEHVLKKERFSLSYNISISSIIAAMSRDKKSQSGNPRIVLLKSIGEVASFDGNYCLQVNSEQLLEALRWLSLR